MNNDKVISKKIWPWSANQNSAMTHHVPHIWFQQICISWKMLKMLLLEKLTNFHEDASSDQASFKTSNSPGGVAVRCLVQLLLRKKVLSSNPARAFQCGLCIFQVHVWVPFIALDGLKKDQSSWNFPICTGECVLTCKTWWEFLNTRHYNNLPNLQEGWSWDQASSNHY